MKRLRPTASSQPKLVFRPRELRDVDYLALYQKIGRRDSFENLSRSAEQKPWSRFARHPRDERIVFVPDGHVYYISVDGKHWINHLIVSCSKVGEHLGLTKPFPSDDEMYRNAGRTANYQVEYMSRFRASIDARPVPMVQFKGTKKLVPLCGVMSKPLPRDLPDEKEERFLALLDWINSHPDEEVFRFNEDMFGEYMAMTQAQIFREWKKAAPLGTALHSDIERFINGVELDPHDEWEATYEIPWKEDSVVHWAQFLQFWEDRGRHLDVYRTEWAIFDECLFLAGSIDLVTVAERDARGNVTAICIWDWKTSKKELAADKLEKYSQQLRFYGHILQTKYGLRVDGMYLVVFSPCRKEYQFIDTSLELDAADSILDKLEQDVRRRISA